MAQSRIGACRLGVALVLALSWSLVGIGAGPASAAVTTESGSAYGYQVNVSLFGGPVNTRGVGQVACTGANTPPGCASTPAASSSPSVVLPAAGGNVTQTDPDGTIAQVGPATFFSSGQLVVSSQGTTGANGSVTSSANISNLNTSGSEALNGTSIASTCTASEAAVSGSTTIAGGTLYTDSGLDVNGNGVFTDPGDHAPVIVNLPPSPAPNTSYTGHIHVNGQQDNFRIVLNEQVVTGSSITVYAAHEYLIGPTAVGDLFIGQSVCGVSTGTTTSTSSTTSTTTGATTTTTAGLTTTTTAGGGGSTGGVGGGAFGYFTRISLFGGPSADRGPAPTVTLPATGSPTPITATVAAGDARYGPGIFFTSGAITVSTEGTTSPKSVTSSTKVAGTNTSKVEVLTATEVSSTCKADGSGVTGSTTITGGKLQTNDGKPDVDGDETVVPVPANPPPNTSFDGTLNSVGDTYRFVVNEQITKPDGSIIVNAAHQYANGPTAKGELVIGQSRCATTATAFPNNPGGAPPGTAAAVAAAANGGGSGGRLAKTGGDVVWLIVMGLMLVSGGSLAMLVGDQLAPRPDGHHRARFPRGRRRLRVARRRRHRGTVVDER